MREWFWGRGVHLLGLIVRLLQRRRSINKPERKSHDT
jgi:hypothetical protein